MRSKSKKSTSIQMPEYQPFPRGIWNMLGAVMLMIVVFALAVSFVSSLLENWYRVEALIYFDFSAIVFFTLLLSIPTILIAFGVPIVHRFLIGLNLVLTLILVGAFLYALAFSDYFGAGIWAVGLTSGLLARKLYRSDRFIEYRDYSQTIWAIHRARKRELK